MKKQLKLVLIPTDKWAPLVISTNKRAGGIFKSEYYSPMKDMGDSYQQLYAISN